MSLKKFMTGCAALGAVVVTGTAASAGGYVDPIIEVEEAVVVAPVVSDWTGGYVGGSLGYSFAGDDEIGFHILEGGEPAGRATELGNTKLKGITAGVQAGYRWQRDRWVFGPELALEGGSVKSGWEDISYSIVTQQPEGTTEYVFDGEMRAKARYIATLAFKTGYEVRPDTLIYGTAGLTHGGFSYEGSSEDGSEEEKYTANGYMVGLGVERKLNERLSGFVEWQYRNYGKTNVGGGDEESYIYTVATPEHHNLKLGVNFRF